MLDFPFNAYVATILSAAFGTWVTLPVWRAWCHKTGLVDDPGHRKIHDRPMALAGGLAVFTGLMLPVACGWLAIELHWLDAEALQKLAHGMSRRLPQVLAIFCGAAGMLMLGWLDDKYELRPAAKFLGQLALATATALAGIRITLFVDSALFSVAVTVLWILTLTNAINFMDNMNGLCAGLGAIGAGCFAATAMGHGHYLVALMALAVSGALLGFLPYNYPRATAFLGDSGSHLTGYLLAVLAILPHFYSAANPNPWAVLSPLAILAVPLVDLAWVVAIRCRQGTPFYQGDTNHLSHRLVRRGLSPPQAVACIWLAALIVGALATFLLARP